ncbi:polyhydroxyalkanoate synthesis repressor PhaR [Erythrobacter sp. 3-20A1M]|uniref:polyhydroxyalkanoate synthesis repressor PhaR n=1 Tax=Erythrobacter sp. 3-20A1M TaxID=2653850 RepID=UPI001BFC5390|nr:polyhydroxyalkanoate synthesis repressor PhaR [Erythrobacter sp. 3-20A1M]QWC58154.1 polyhydroxyalkanoate synthesis repressor PhaR [Erythrobacter sp. 3-20A1M]
MASKNTKTDSDETVVIKKYANRRLYNTASSSYITLDDLARMTREGVEFKVIDAKTGDDLTRTIMTQIIMEAETNGAEMLPISFLRQIISLYGHSMQPVMPHFLEAAMENFSTHRPEWQKAMESGWKDHPFARIAENNMEMMRAATEAFMGGGRKDKPAPATTDEAPAAKGDDLAEMRAQMAAMQKRLDELGK